MRITLTVDDSVFDCSKPYDRAHWVTAGGWQCVCGSDRVNGLGKYIEDHDIYAAEAKCADCSKRCGKLRVRVPTIFGLEEDERVLYDSRCRVY